MGGGRTTGRGWILPGLAIFLALGWIAERAEKFGAARKRFRDPAVPAAMLNRGSLGAALRELRMVKPAPNDLSIHLPSPHQKAGLDANLFQKKRKIGATLYVANPTWAVELAEHAEPKKPWIDPEWIREGWVLVAAEISEKDLSDPTWGIERNYEGHGREWERPAALAIRYPDGQTSGTLAGMRLHGGRSRAPVHRHSYRIHFREALGHVSLPRGEALGPEWEGLRRAVVRIEGSTNHPFSGELSYAAAELVGCVVPLTHPARFALNGKLSPEAYCLTEQVDRSSWARRLGHKNFLMYFMKAQQESRADKAYGEFRRKVVYGAAPLDMEEMEALADLDNLSAYILSVAYCGTTDGFQGAALMDLEAKTPRWAWINWDMDHGFVDYYAERFPPRAPWEQESWELAYKREGFRNYASWRIQGDVRSILFSRLMDESPAYRERFLRFASDALNHRLTEENLEGPIARMEKLAKGVGGQRMESFGEYREFVRRRPELLRQGLASLFGAGPARRVEVDLPAGAWATIDGYRRRGTYVGHYFEGQEIELVGDEGGGIRGWAVEGGREYPGRRVKIAIDGDMRIGPA